MFDKIKNFIKRHKIDLQILIILILTFIAVNVREIANENEVEKLATVNLQEITNINDLYQLSNQLAKLQKDLNHILTNVDSKNVTQLNTNITKISSANGSTKIDGNQLVMDDTNTTRLKLGYNPDTMEFEFILYDGLGNESISLDSNGEAVFSGNITTANDAYVGNNLYIGDGGAINDTKVIYLNDNCVLSTQNKDLIIGNYNVDGDINIITNNKLRFFDTSDGTTRQSISYGTDPTLNSLITILEGYGLVEVI